MDFVIRVFNLQIALFLLIAVGFIAAKTKIITPVSRKSLSDILILIVLPCNTVASFLGNIAADKEFATDCLLALVISAAIQITVTFAGRFLFAKMDTDKKNVCSYGMICSNSSFIGMPVAEALYGSMGVLFTSIFQIPIRFTMWTAGLALFTNVDRKAAFRKLVTHPCIIAIFVGFAVMLLPFKLPVFISNPIVTVSRCTTPLSMLVIGSILSEADFRTLFSKKVLYFSFIRLIAFPLLVYAILRLTGVNPLLVSIAVIMSGMPAGSTASILADKYDSDALFASQIIFVSTLISIFTIPVLGYLVENL